MALHGVLLAALSPGAIAAARAYNAVARARGAPCIFAYDASAHILDPSVRAGADAHSNEKWGDATFMSAAWARPEIARELVTAGFSVLSMDVDMVLFKDLRAAWPPAVEPGFIPTACDWARETPDGYNTGAMLLTHAMHVGALNSWLGRCTWASKCCYTKNEQTTFQQTDGIKRACIDKNVLNHICNKHPPNPLLNAA